MPITNAGWLLKPFAMWVWLFIEWSPRDNAVNCIFANWDHLSGQDPGTSQLSIQLTRVDGVLQRVEFFIIVNASSIRFVCEMVSFWNRSLTESCPKGARKLDSWSITVTQECNCLGYWPVRRILHFIRSHHYIVFFFFKKLKIYFNHCYTFVMSMDKKSHVLPFLSRRGQ